MDQPMKGAGGEQKGGGWEEEEEGEGVRANRLWSPHKDWPRTEGEDREVGGNWGRGRGDPLLPCPRNRLPPGSCSPSPGTPAQAGGDRTPTTVSFHHYLRPPPISSPALNGGSLCPFLFSFLPVPFLYWKVLEEAPARFPLQTFCPLCPHPPTDAHPLPYRGPILCVCVPASAWCLHSPVPPVRLPPPPRAAALDCPNAILESMALAES